MVLSLRHLILYNFDPEYRKIQELRKLDAEREPHPYFKRLRYAFETNSPAETERIGEEFAKVALTNFSEKFVREINLKGVTGGNAGKSVLARSFIKAVKKLMGAPNFDFSEGKLEWNSWISQEKDLQIFHRDALGPDSRKDPIFPSGMRQLKLIEHAGLNLSAFAVFDFHFSFGGSKRKLMLEVPPEVAETAEFKNFLENTYHLRTLDY